MTSLARLRHDLPSERDSALPLAMIVTLRSILPGTPTPTDAQLAAITAPTLPDPKLSFTAFSVTRVVPNPPYSYPTTFTTGPYAGFSGLVTDTSSPRRSAATTASSHA